MAGIAERAVHEGLHLTAGALLRNGRRREPPAPAARYVTSIVRVPAEVADRLEPVLDRLRALDPRHSYYAPEQLHVTVANLDGLRGPLDRAERVLAEARALPLAARGLGLSPGTVLLRVEPLDGSFLRLRRRLRALGDAPPGLCAALLRPALGRIVFANVVRFRESVGADFVAEVGRLRRLELGTWTAREVEIVRTDRLLSPEATDVLARIRLE